MSMSSDSNPHVVQDADMSMWDDPSLNSLYDNFGASVESPFDGSRLFDMAGAGVVDSPGFALKGAFEDDATRTSHQIQPFQSRSLVSSRSAESSSQDSASETSGRKRQNTDATSESPPGGVTMAGVKLENESANAGTGMGMSMGMGMGMGMGISMGMGMGMGAGAGAGAGADAGVGVGIRPESVLMDQNNAPSIQSFGRSMHNLSLEPDYANANSMATTFDFDSAASSPGGAMDTSESAFARMHNHMERPHTGNGRPNHDPPMATVEPSQFESSQFFFGSSTASPASAKAPQGQDASPSAIFSNPTPSSDGADLFSNNQIWNNTPQNQNPAWTNDYSNAFASPGNALAITPSPVMHHATTAKPNPPKPVPDGNRIPLHVAPIPAKSRVETQINIRLTLDWLPPGVKNLHLPTHTIAKAKLLSKEQPPSDDTLELQTMLVCTSAMTQPLLRQRAMERAAAQDNAEIQSRGQSGSTKKEDDDVDEDDKPANGGEVRICTNCINRERKRAARKKLKKEEEQAHWEKYETERVIVFNTNEYKPWQEWQQSPAPKDNSMQASDFYRPAETAMQVVAPMRIACYCRHQNEKDGFQVIFTLKDHLGKVVAQEMSDSILITDDHKTHPLATVAGQVWFDGQFNTGAAYGSHSMVDLHSHAQALQQSKSTSNLPSYNPFGGQPFPPPNNVHPMSNMASQATTPGTMTPRNLSRPVSPTNAGQSGPSKKRKSSSAHRRIPSTLTMTRVDANQAMPPATMPSTTPFSPSSAGFVGSSDTSYIAMPHSASRAQFHTGPSTPIDQNPPFPFGSVSRNNSIDGGSYAFYSAPSSAHQSRAPSPVLVGPNLAAFQRQQAHGGANALPTRPHPFNMAGANMAISVPEPERRVPIINKVNPVEGPVTGGTEVSVYGSNFTPDVKVMFGDQEAVATTFWGEKALVAILPTANQGGPVPITIASNQRQYPSSPPPGQPALFTYNADPTSDTMAMALRYYSQKDTGRADNWQIVTHNAARAWSQGTISTGHSQFQAQQAAQFTDQTSDMRFA